MAFREQDKIIDRSYPPEVIMAMDRDELIDHKVAIRLGEWSSGGRNFAKARDEQVAAYRERFPEGYAHLRTAVEAELVANNAIQPVDEATATPEPFTPADANTETRAA